MENTKIAFFFGAGAEVDFGLPAGVQYTLDTILSKRSKMNAALRDFYKDKLSDNFSPYYSENMFSVKSHTFREIVFRACRKAKEDDDKIETGIKILELSKKYEELEKEKESEEKQNCKKDLDKQIKDIFDFVMLDIDETKNSMISKRPRHLSEAVENDDRIRLLNYFTYYGSIEKDFSTIINPKSAGIKRFWRLINYFWSAFFSILFPVLKLSAKYGDAQEDTEGLYKGILEHLPEVIKYIYSDGYKEKLEESYKNSYYRKISQIFPESIAATTNYTPFLEFSAFRKKIFLAGKLSQFEIPDELRIVDLKESQDIVNKMIFPFLLTQAPVKPIINGTQLEEYNAFIDFLKDLRTLVIIGYGMNENDDHINALLRGFLTQSSDKKIVYCKFLKGGEIFDITKSVDEVAQRLRISDEAVKHQIYVIPHHGEPENIVEKLKEIKL